MLRDRRGCRHCLGWGGNWQRCLQRNRRTHSPDADDARGGSGRAESACAGEEFGMNSFALADCTTVDAALSQLKDGAVVKAGGVDLLGRMKNGTIQPDEACEYPQHLLTARNSRRRKWDLRLARSARLLRSASTPSFAKKYQILSDACGHAATPIYEIWQRWAATSCNRFGAGTSVRRSSNASGRARSSASHSRGSTSTTPSWIMGHAPRWRRRRRQ